MTMTMRTKCSGKFIYLIYVIMFVMIFHVTTMKSQPVDASGLSNVAQGKQAYQSSSAYSNEGEAELAVDGNFNQYWSGKSCSHTSGENGDYWEVDLGDIYVIDDVIVYNRKDSCCNGNLVGLQVYIGLTKDSYRLIGHETGTIYTSKSFKISPPSSARWVRLTRSGSIKTPVMLCEVAVMGFKPTFMRFLRLSDSKGTGTSLETMYARSWEQCCFICSNDPDCLAVEMTNSQCTLLDSDKHETETGKTLYTIN